MADVATTCRQLDIVRTVPRRPAQIAGVTDCLRPSSIKQLLADKLVVTEGLVGSATYQSFRP